MDYQEEDFLQLSGLQHFAFCRRQWALIHVEKQWAENFRTTDGSLMHRRVHQAESSESRGNLLVKRAVRVYSPRLGVSGECDVVEFHRSEQGIAMTEHKGLWQPYPVEYKRGKPGTTRGDILQLCGQAICLEEMLCCDIPEGAIFYGEPRRREIVTFSMELRREVEEALEEMHWYFQRGYTPKVRTKKGCSACSLKELCLPGMLRRKPVANYLKEALEEK